jgi:2,3-bisphosphoglycerate-dependent phosphoglycerate mutase
VLDLVLIRHGQSTWNAENLFTGWVDVDLTPAGEAEARAGGELLAAVDDLDLRVLHTSVLTRAIRTAELALAAAGRTWLPVRRDWRLNERHYGDLQGKNKAVIKQEYGAAQLQTSTRATSRAPSASRTWWPAPCPTGSRPSCPTSGPPPPTAALCS